VPFEASQRIAPELSVLVQPLVDLTERPCIQAIDPFSPVSALGYELCISQYAQMSGDCRPANPEGCGDVPRRGITIRKKPQNLAASRIGGCAKYALQRRTMRNHMVTRY
jgi:hypothetical protein